MPDIDDLVKDFAVKRIATEAPYDFHKIDIEDVIQVYMDLFGTDPADDMGMNRGGLMGINRMTAPLGYALGGPAGREGRPTSAPELYEGYDPILGNWMKDRKMRQAQPPAGAVDMTGQHVAPPERPRWDKARELGKKGLEGIKGLGSKSIDVLRQLLGSKSAEAGVYIPDETLDEMSIDEFVREIELLGPPMFGMSVGPNYVQHLRDLANALEKKIGD